MASVTEFLPARPEQHDTMGISRQDVLLRREHKSRSKAEKILGVSDFSGWQPQKNFAEGQRKHKRRGANFGFSFSDLRDTLTGAHRHNGATRVLARNPTFATTTNDSDSTSSSPSPTFDPTASTSTLPSTYSSPISPRVDQKWKASNSVEPSFSHDDTVGRVLRTRLAARGEMPPIAECRTDSDINQQQKNFGLPPLDLPPLSPTSSEAKGSLRFSLSRNKSTASVLSHGSESTSKGRSVGQKNVPWIERFDPFQPGLPRTTQKLSSTRLGKNVQEWLESADLNRSPSLAGRPIPQPQEVFQRTKRNAFSPTSSCTSIRTLTSQPEAGKPPASPKSTMSHWPLPATNFNLGDTDALLKVKSSRAFDNDLQIESVLCLSSDEESDGESDSRKTIRQSQSTFVSQKTGMDGSNHSRARSASNASVVSSIIQLDPHNIPSPRTPTLPSEFPKPVGARQASKRTLADIAAAGAESRKAPFFAANWQQNDETELSLKTLAAAGQESLAADTTTPLAKPIATKPWERAEILAGNGSTPSEEKELVTHTIEATATTSKSREIVRSACRTTAKDGTTDQAEGGDNIEEELDISSFPVPPRSRSNSIVPTIQVEMMDDGQKRESRPPVPEFPAESVVLLTPSTASKASSIRSNCPSLPSKGNSDKLPLQLQELQGSEVDAPADAFSFFDSSDRETGGSRSALQRTRTISNVPIYVTGLDSSGSGSDVDGKDGVAEFVFSNLY